MNLLIVDDDRLTIKVLEKALTKWGYEHTSVTDGSSCIEVLKKDPSINLLLLDWEMPNGISGLEVLEKLKKQPVPQPLYVILITGHTDKSYLVQALESGADDFITKPLDLDILKARVKVGERNVTSQLELLKLNSSLDQEVQARTADVTAALKMAENASTMKSHFLANMSHEIRTPLNGIVSYVELLLGSDLSQEQREDLLTISSSVHSLRTIINDVLDFSKIEAGKMLIEKAPFDLRQSAKEIFDILLREAEIRGVDVITTIDPKIPVTIVGDRVRFQQILTNLLSNALKFSPSDRAVVVQIMKDSDGSADWFHLSVTDTGIGIPPEKMGAIFDSFVQVDSSTTRKYGGTGLGLSIVKQLTELMGGMIWVQSQVDLGTTFHVRLPLIEDRSKKDIDKESELSEQIDISGLSVLLAEDNLDNQKGLTRILERAGCKVTAVDDGLKLVEAAFSSKYDVILADIQMPLMGGEDACRKIRSENCINASVPIIGLTANVVVHEMQRYTSAGIDDIIGKPIDFNRLFSTIVRFVGR